VRGRPSNFDVAKRNLTASPSRGPNNSLLYCFRDVSRFRVAWNWFWIASSKVVPWFAFKRFMLRMTGMKIGKHAAIAYNVQPDVLFPQLITIGENAIVGYNTVILCHEYLRKEYRVGPVTIEKDATIGAGCLLLAGSTVREGAVVSGMSLVNADVSGFVGGVPAKPLSRA
jgi:acetyltransferase-like isoleucine patch superfamily enzyme